MQRLSTTPSRPTTPSRRLARSTSLVALAIGALILAACAGGDPSVGGNARVAPEAEQPAARPSAPEGGRTGATTAPNPTPSFEGALGSSDLTAVYRLIREGYVDPVDHATLVTAATTTLRESAVRGGALPLDTAPLDLAPGIEGNPESDWLAFARAYDVIVQKYPTWAGEVRPDRAILRRMLSSLGDDHSLYIEPDEVRRMGETSFTGIGVRMSKPTPNEPPVLVEVFQGSPAARAGLRPGDRVVAVDGKQTQGLSLTEVVSSVRGQQGIPVVVSISRGGSPGLETRITRGAVETPRVEGSIRAGVIGVLRIRTFGEGVPEAVQQVLTQGRNRGARAWIVDLRGNNGGSLEAMARVAANFIDNRTVGLAVDRSGTPEPINAIGRAAIPRMPMVVLVDKETASEAEILAAAIKEYGVAPLVGTKTAGSVGIAAPRPLSDGSAVQITIRRLVTPSGATIDKIGVQPDNEVELTIQDLESGEDPQLLRAAEVLVGGGGLPAGR